MPEQPKNIKISIVLAIAFVSIVVLVYLFKIYPQYKRQASITQTQDRNLQSSNVDRSVENTSQELQTPQEDPTKNWKIYRNERYKFEVKIPEGWQIKTIDSGVYFGTKIEQYNYSNIDDGYGFLDARENYFDYGHDAPGSKISEEIVNIDEVAATQRIYEGEGDEETGKHISTKLEIYDFIKDGNYYHIEFTSAVKNEALWNDFSTLIKSWKFL